MIDRVAEWYHKYEFKINVAYLISATIVFTLALFLGIVALVDGQSYGLFFFVASLTLIAISGSVIYLCILGEVAAWDRDRLADYDDKMYVLDQTIKNIDGEVRRDLADARSDVARLESELFSSHTTISGLQRELESRPLAPTV
jgi:hypothetical protein